MGVARLDVGSRFTSALLDPAATDDEETSVKNDIHPDYHTTNVTCSCGATFTTRSAAASSELRADVCSACHPFYTGKQKILDTGGRVARFNQRYGNRTKAPAKA